MEKKRMRDMRNKSFEAKREQRRAALYLRRPQVTGRWKLWPIARDLVASRSVALWRMSLAAR